MKKLATVAAFHSGRILQSVFLLCPFSVNHKIKTVAGRDRSAQIYACLRWLYWNKIRDDTAKGTKTDKSRKNAILTKHL